LNTNARRESRKWKTDDQKDKVKKRAQNAMTNGTRILALLF